MTLSLGAKTQPNLSTLRSPAGLFKREKAMLRKISLIAAIFATVSLPAAEALAWRTGGVHGGYRGGYRTGYYHGYRGGYYRPGYGVGAAAAGAALGAAAASAYAYPSGGYYGGNSCWQWNGYSPAAFGGARNLSIC